MLDLSTHPALLPALLISALHDLADQPDVDSRGPSSIEVDFRIVSRITRAVYLVHCTIVGWTAGRATIALRVEWLGRTLTKEKPDFFDTLLTKAFGPAVECLGATEDEPRDRRYRLQRNCPRP
jgi:hypothetical protein